MLKRRVANDGHPYTYADFVEHYGDVAHLFWLAALPALVEPTLEQPYRQHFARAPQPGNQRASAGFAVPGRIDPQPEPPPALQGQAQLEAPLAPPAQRAAALPVPIAPHLELPPSPPGALQPGVLLWADTHFCRQVLPAQLQNVWHKHYTLVDSGRGAINLAYELHDFLPLPDTAFCVDGLKDVLNMPHAVCIAAERVHRVPDLNRNGMLRVDFFCYMPDGHVCRKHHGRSKPQDALDHWMPLTAGLYDLTVASQHGVGQAMHRVPPVVALAQGAPQGSGTVVLAGLHLNAFSVFDRTHWTWHRLQEVLQKLLHSHHPLDITLGEQAPWWLFIAQTLSLREIVQGGITQVVADLEYQKVILMITTVDGHWRIWYCPNGRQLKTQRF